MQQLGPGCKGKAQVKGRARCKECARDKDKVKGRGEDKEKNRDKDECGVPKRSGKCKVSKPKGQGPMERARARDP